MKKRNIGLAIFAIASLCAAGVFTYNINFNGAGTVKAEVMKSDGKHECKNVSTSVTVNDLAFDKGVEKVEIYNSSTTDTFDVTVSYNAVDGSTVSKEQMKLTPQNNKSNPINIDYGNKVSGGGQVVIRVELPDPGNHQSWECWNEYTVDVADKSDSYVGNTNLDMCNDWLSLKTLYSKSLKDAVKEYSADEKADLQAFLRTNLPYCTQEQVEYNYQADALKGTMENIERIYYTNKSINTGDISTNDDEFPEDLSFYEEVQDTQNLPLLQCKVNSDYLEPNKLEDPSIDQQALNVGDNANKPGSPNLYLYKHTETGDPISYTDTDGTNHEVCKVTCTEFVKVNFDPPQEVKAGLCFSYAVQVIAKSECKADYTNTDIPQLKPSCTPYPHCNNVSGHEDSAGPDEDYDACIEECDGGKYTQSCADKCYTKVYEEGKSYTEENSSLETHAASMLATPMAKEVGTCPPERGTTWQQLYDYFQTYYTGKFTASNGRILYEPVNLGTCYWNGYAPYYFSTPALAQKTWSTDVKNGGNYRATRDGDYQSYGFRKNNGGCSNNCVWLGCSADAVSVDPDKALEDYNTNLERYNNAKVQCDASAKCESTDVTTSTFTIGVDDDNERWKETNDTGGKKHPGDEGGTCDYGTPESDKIIQGRDGDENTITQGTGGACYCGDNNYRDWHHYTRWTFPGSWYNIKTGKVISTPPSEGEKDSYSGGYNKYCVPRTNEEVNLGWMAEYYANGKDRTKSTVQPEKWNIHAMTQNFGTYNWKIKMDCFYSVSNTEDFGPGTPDGGPDESTSDANIRYKAADPSNLLPGADGEEKISYNWSDSATKLDIENYEITPGAYKEEVESIGDDVFTDKYLDYEFNLSGADMASIARNGDNYGVYEGDTVAIVGADEKKANTLYAYKSDLIRSLKNSKYPKPEALKCNNIENYKSTACSQFRNPTVTAMYQTYLARKNS